jgi:hypothetical protein
MVRDGGPWVKPEQAMKKYVWSETAIPGGGTFSGRLPSPPSVTGPIQSRAEQDPIGQMGGAGAHPPSVPDFYRDAVVIAYLVHPPLGMVARDAQAHC